MAGYIGSKSSVTQVDGYNRTEADDRYVNVAGDTMTGDLAGTNLTLSGGVYLGGTGAANLLDDYEEGEHSPTWNGGGTISVSYYKYVKIGSLVLLNYDFTLPTTSVTDVTLITLPFTTVDTYAAGSVLYTTSASKPMAAGTNGNNLSFRVDQNGSLTCNALSGKRIIGSLVYNTSA